MNNNFFIKNFFIIFVAAFICSFILNEHTSYAKPDPDNCLMCHDHPGFARMNENGIKRNFYIEEDIFITRSVHGDVRCVDCHDYILEGNEPKIPHQPNITEKVHCSNVCHSVIEPSRANSPNEKKYFSHENVYAAYKESSHGVADRLLPDDKRDKDAPYCVYCHDRNPVYQRVGSKIPPIIEPQLKRCRGCHKDEFAARFYRHTKHRMDLNTRRSKYQIVQLCVECHGNDEMMSRHKLSSAPVSTYEKTFHYKMIYHGGERWAACTDCHSKTNYPMDPNRPSGGDAGIHQIYSKKNPKASVFITEESHFNPEKDNLVKTCSVEICHPKAKGSKSFARSVGHIAPHNYIGLFLLEEGFFWLCYGTLAFVLTMITLDLVRKILG